MNQSKRKKTRNERSSYPSERGVRHWKDQFGIPRSAYIMNCMSCAVYLNDDREHITRCPACTQLHNRQIQEERKEQRKKK